MVAAELALLAVMAGGAVLGVLLMPLDRCGRLLRVCVFAAGYLAMEIAVMVACAALWVAHPSPGRHRRGGIWEERHFRLLRWALGVVLGAARSAFGYRVVVEAGAEQLAGDGPLLLLARHGGPGDSFTLVHLLLSRGWRVRVVLKGLLQADPALDVLLNRLSACFLPSGAAGREARTAGVEAAAAGLEGSDALLVFPEGGNWTPARQRRAVRYLRDRRDHTQAGAAQLMTHVLPPRAGGLIAALRAKPGLDVVVAAHTGLDKVVTLGAAWKALPLTVPMTVRFWRTPTRSVPSGEEALRQWLLAQWAVIDEWIDARRGADAASPATSAAIE